MVRNTRRHRSQHKKFKNKRMPKFVDEVEEDIKPQSMMRLTNQPIDHEKPGKGQFYCVHCAKYFIDDHAMQGHFRSKGHKKRLREMRTEPYTQAEADRAAGMGSYVAPKKRKIEQQPERIVPIVSTKPEPESDSEPEEPELPKVKTEVKLEEDEDMPAPKKRKT